VLAPVVEDVDERVPNFARRAENPGVEAIRPHAPVTAERAVHRLGDPDGESLDPTCEPHWCVRLDQQVHVVALNAEVDDPKAVATCGGQGGTDRSEDATLSKGRESRRRTQRHVRGAAPIMDDASDVRDQATTWSGLPPGAATAATPRRDGKLELSRRRHLNLAYITN
jgi:hypothetical protein